jgi:hypothetical protein
MAEKDVTEAFESGIKLEESFLELRMLMQSYSDLSGDSPLIFTIEKALARVYLSLQEHQFILHNQLGKI